MARINTNIASLIAQRNLAQSNSDLGVRLQRPATGLQLILDMGPCRHGRRQLGAAAGETRARRAAGRTVPVQQPVVRPSGALKL